jgi:hypothetical protein
VKHRLWAAVLASTAVILGAGAVVGGPVNLSIKVNAWDSGTHVATGDVPWLNAFITERVKHTAGTLHQFIPNPFEVNPGPCRAIAIEWNVAVFLNRQQSTFDKLIGKAAKHQCTLVITTPGAANADGSFDLLTAAPSK